MWKSLPTNILSNFDLSATIKGLEEFDFPLNADDYAALQAFYTSTSGENWRNNFGWDISSETPPPAEVVNNWHGVTVEEGRVTKIEMNRNNLSGMLPEELGNLSNLQKLRLQSNSISGSIPSELGSLGNLQDLGSLKIVGRSGDELEDLLEALQLADHLEQQRLDVGPKFKEGRHTSTFRALTPGKLWTVRRVVDNSEKADVARAQEEAKLPAGLAADLDRLNSLQSDYDRAGQELEDRRTQTFADWYKYMVCVYPPETSRESYPDIDEVKFFIEEKDIRPLRDLQARTGTLEVDDSGNVEEPKDSGDTLAHRLKQALETVTEQLRKINAEAKAKAKAEGKAEVTLVLQPLAPPRYYLPSEPVVLITGDAATPSDRHGQDGRLHPEGLLECLVTEIPESDLASKQTVETVRGQIVSLFSSLSNSIGINVWQHQPWHPILLQWEVEFFPTRDGNNLDPSNRTYAPQFMQQNYQFAEKDVELRIKQEKIPPEKAANVYSGTTILSPAARPVLSERILIYLEKHLLGDYYEAQNIAEDQQTADYFQTHRDEILNWYKTSGSDDKFKQLIYVYEHLEANSGSNLCQSLGGFNDALLMHKVTRQTPIADPIGFEPYRTFTEQDVRQVVGQHGIKAPQPLNDFNPIRAGALKLLGLRLIDNFGIAHDVNLDRMTTTQQLRLEGHPDWVAMLPRLAQPARINFRWLDADHDQKTRETNSHPETTPICGWLLPNNLDDSLAVYDRDGRALGSLYALADSQDSALAQWRSAPGRETEVAIADLANEHLRKTIEYIQGRGAEFVGHFLAAIDTALAGIDPESAKQHRSLALLMGRPVAVVRAKVDLQLLGLPAYNQAWNVFRQDMHRSRRETDGFTQVEFPIRIGEYHQLNDGLVGYWLEDEAFQIQGPFYAAQSEPNDSADIITYHGEPIAITQAIDSPPQYLTMLVDPRGVVHATSGILPTKAISLPADLYRDALRHIEVTFFSAPILSEAQQLDLPLPKEAGFLWSWLQKETDGWTELSTLQTIRRSVFVAAMGMEGDEGNALWQNLVQQKWLSSLDEETAIVVAADRRPDLTGDLATQQDRIEKALDSPTVDPARLEAHFLSQATVREGWLKLRKVRG
ncbi:MAG: hypothetical protein EBE86_012130 [Hormoscilla sp. GUM202]|nr:hypothetical protein [Hormoscilla sp. GUM202]